MRLTTPDLLIVDDLGLRTLERSEVLDLYEIIRIRYERGSILITTNRTADELFALFGDKLLASSAMDRLLHHAHSIELKGRSWRTSRRHDSGENGVANT